MEMVIVFPFQAQLAVAGLLAGNAAHQRAIALVIVDHQTVQDREEHKVLASIHRIVSQAVHRVQRVSKKCAY